MKASSPGNGVMLGFLALFVLAATTGFLVGQAGPDATLLSPVLPLIVAGGGAAVLGLNFKDGVPVLPPPGFRAFAAYGVIIFCLAFLVFIQLGLSFRTWTVANSYYGALVLHYEHLSDCGREELRTNFAREKLDLEPLPTTAFCSSSPPI